MVNTNIGRILSTMVITPSVPGAWGKTKSIRARHTGGWGKFTAGGNIKQLNKPASHGQKIAGPGRQPGTGGGGLHSPPGRSDEVLKQSIPDTLIVGDGRCDGGCDGGVGGGGGGDGLGRLLHPSGTSAPPPSFFLLSFWHHDGSLVVPWIESSLENLASPALIILLLLVFYCCWLSISFGRRSKRLGVSVPHSSSPCLLRPFPSWGFTVSHLSKHSVIMC